jgi:MFS family permease
MATVRRILLTFFPLWAFAFAFKLGGGLHYTLLPTLGEHIFPLWLVGVVIGASSLLQMLLDVPAGYLLDRFGYTRLLLLGTILFCLSPLSFLFGLHPWTYAINLIGSTLGWLFFRPGIDAYILTVSPASSAGKFLATRDVTQSAGTVAGMAALSFVLPLPVPVMGVIVSGALIMAILALCFVPTAKNSTLAEQKKISHQSYYIRRHFLRHVFRSLKKLNPASSLLLLSGLSSSTFYAILWFIIPLLIQRGIQAHTLSIGLAIFDLAVVIAGFFIGQITDTWSKRWLIFWGLLLFAITAFLIGFDFGWIFLLFGFLATTGDEISSVSLWAWLDHLDQDHTEDGLIAGTISLARDLGWAIGPVIAGCFFQFLGATWTIACGSVLIFITWLISCVWTHRIPQDPFLRPPSTHAPRKHRHKH